MLEDVEENRPFMKRIKSTGDITEPWDTSELIKYRLKSKPSTPMAIDVSERKLTIH